VQGAPLVGASARVSPNLFLFAMSNSMSDRVYNVGHLTNGRWMDLALIYATGKRAVVTLEKDNAAQKLFTETLVDWGSTPFITSQDALDGDTLLDFAKDGAGAERVLSNDIRVALAGDKQEGFGYVGVWAIDYQTCRRIDKSGNAVFAVITRSTFRNGPKAWFGNFGSMTDGRLLLSTSGQRVELQQLWGNTLAVNGRPLVKCSALE
jgi:hypothetical protein